MTDTVKSIVIRTPSTGSGNGSDTDHGSSFKAICSFLDDFKPELPPLSKLKEVIADIPAKTLYLEGCHAAFSVYVSVISVTCDLVAYQHRRKSTATLQELMDDRTPYSLTIRGMDDDYLVSTRSSYRRTSGEIGLQLDISHWVNVQKLLTVRSEGPWITAAPDGSGHTLSSHGVSSLAGCLVNMSQVKPSMRVAPVTATIYLNATDDVVPQVNSLVQLKKLRSASKRQVVYIVSQYSETGT